MPKGWNNLSTKQTLKALTSLGFSEVDAIVYIFLATKAPQNATDIANALRMNKQRLYPCLRKLQKKGVVNCTEGKPALFSAVPMEEALNVFIKTNVEKAQQMEVNKEKILSSWRSMMNDTKHRRE
jgi:sugar-specific transcriptional regulator TrmB